MGVCSCTSKFVIVIINIFFWLGTAFLVYAGVSYLTRADGVVDDVNHKPAYITFGVAALLFVCGLIGMIGAFSEKKFLLGMFSVVVLGTLALLIFTSTVLFVKENAVMNETDTFMARQYNNYGNPNLTAGMYFATEAPFTTTPDYGSGNGSSTPSQSDTTAAVVSTTTTVTTTATTPAPKPDMNATDFVDKIQENLECCGYENYTDWNSYDYWTTTLNHKGYVPKSCCNETAAKEMNKTCTDLVNVEKYPGWIYTNACKTEVHTLVNFVYKFLEWTSLIFAIFLFLGFCATMFLMCRKRSSDGFNYSSIIA